MAKKKPVKKKATKKKTKKKVTKSKKVSKKSTKKKKAKKRKSAKTSAQTIAQLEKKVAALSKEIQDLKSRQSTTTKSRAIATPKRTRATVKKIESTHSKLQKFLHNDWRHFSRCEEKAKCACNRFRQAYQLIPGINQIDVGFREKNGMVLVPPEHVIVVYVDKWRPKEEVGQEFLIPEFFDGIRVNVIERNFFKASGDLNEHRKFHKNPLGGISITTEDSDNWGTLGMQCYLPDGNGGYDKSYITNAHVIGHRFARVLQPDQSIGHSDKERTVGMVSDFSNETSQSIDVAFITTNEARSPDSIRLLEEDPNFDMPEEFTEGGSADLEKHQTEVFKIGASTGGKIITVGIVEEVNSHDVTVFDKHANKSRTYKNQIIVKPKTPDSDNPIIKAGDSGSVLFTIKSENGKRVNRVVGLVHGMSTPNQDLEKPQDERIIACSFDDIRAKWPNLRISKPD